MQQGDQYSIRVPVTDSSGAYITPSTCTDIKINIGGTVKQYTEDELTYDSTNNVWLYPLTQEESFEMRGRVPCQVSVNFGSQYVYSDIKTITVKESMIKDEW